MRQGPPRRVPLPLYGVDLGRVAAQVGLGDTAGGWDTGKVLAALNVKCASPPSLLEEKEEEARRGERQPCGGSWRW